MKATLEQWRSFLGEAKGGTILAIFGPSGSGKSRQKNIFKRHGWDEIISYVTRPPRGEADIEYEFTTEEDWKEESEKGNLINTNQYGGNFYGTKITDFRNANKAILVTDITNINGSRGEEDLKNVAIKEGKNLILLFSAPPQEKELVRRHLKRLESGEYGGAAELKDRLLKARQEAEKMRGQVKELGTLVHTIYSDEDAERLAEELV